MQVEHPLVEGAGWASFFSGECRRDWKYVEGQHAHDVRTQTECNASLKHFATTELAAQCIVEELLNLRVLCHRWSSSAGKAVS